MVLIPEIPGIHPGVLALGNHLVDNGFTVVIPSLFGEPGRPETAAYVVPPSSGLCGKGIRGVCHRQARPVSLYLRAWPVISTRRRRARASA